MKTLDTVKRLDPGYLLKEAFAVMGIRDRGAAMMVYLELDGFIEAAVFEGI